MEIPEPKPRAPTPPPPKSDPAHPIMDAVDKGVEIAGKIVLGVGLGVGLSIAFAVPAIVMTVVIVPISVPVAIRSLIKHRDLRAVPDYLHVTYPAVSAYKMLYDNDDRPGKYAHTYGHDVYGGRTHGRCVYTGRSW